MIYLIKTEYKNITLLKIGYTEDISSRMNAYKTHNPLCELLDTREGDKELESFLHNYFIKYKYITEWFTYDEEIVKKFKIISITDPFPNPELVSSTKPSSNSISQEKDRLKNIILNILNINNKHLVGKFFKFNNLIDYFSEFKRTEKDWKKLYDDIAEFYKNSLKLSFPIPEKDYFISKLKDLGLCFNDDIQLTSEEIRLIDFLKKFIYKQREFTDRMRLYCEFADKWGNTELKRTNKIDNNYHLYYDVLGSAKIKAMSYKEIDIKREIKFIRSKDLLFSELASIFILGQRYTRTFIKEQIRAVYQKFGIVKTPKATDLLQYFNVKNIKITIKGKREEGFEILSIK